MANAPSDLICQKCNHITSDPYSLPCGHFFCFTPCIAPNDGATNVICPLCQRQYSVEQLTPDSDRCDRANAHLLQQTMRLNGGLFQPLHYQPPDNDTSFQENNPTNSGFEQTPQMSPHSLNPTNQLPNSQPRSCSMCKGMVFGLHDIPAFSLSVCPNCQRKCFENIVTIHNGKIIDLKKVANQLESLKRNLSQQLLSGSSSSIEEELNSAIAFLYDKVDASFNRSVYELKDNESAREKFLLDIYKNTNEILPSIAKIPDRINEYEAKNVRVGKWIELKKQISEIVKSIEQVKEGAQLRGTESFEFDPSDAHQVVRELQELRLIIRGPGTRINTLNRSRSRNDRFFPSTDSTRNGVFADSQGHYSSFMKNASLHSKPIKGRRQRQACTHSSPVVEVFDKFKLSTLPRLH